MKKFLKHTLALFLGILLFACQEDLEVGDAGSKVLSGDWVVSEYSLEGEFLYGPYTLQLYNTSYGTDSVWIDNIYDSGIKIKSKKLSETTFGVTGANDVNEEYANKIDVLDAQVIGNDSIVFRVVLYKADGTIQDDYLEAGHRYTGWED